MATQYTSILKLALPVQGELSGTWGDVVNDNITSMVEEAIAGRAVINTWTANSHTLTTADGTTSESRAAILTLTDTGTALTGAGTVICPAASKIYIVENGTGQTITVKTSSGTGVAVPNTKNMVVFCDGTNVEEGITNINSLTLNGDGATVSSIKDEDNMASDSATALATQQSIKAYVDSQVGSFDTLAEVLAQGNTTGGTDIAVGTGDDITFADNSKVIFGAGSDLSVYSDGTDGLITSTGHLTLDVTGIIKLDADNAGTVYFQDAGTIYGVVEKSSSNMVIRSGESDGDILFKGNDGGSTVTALTLDMSAAGAATFNGNLTVNGADVTVTANIKHAGDSDTYYGFHGDDLWRVVTGGTERLEASNSGIIVNDSGADADFRVESNSNTHALFVDAGNDRVGLFTSSPAAPLDIQFGDNANILRGSYASGEDNFFLELDSAIVTSGVVGYQFHLTNNGTAYNNTLTLDRGNVGIGVQSASAKLHVNGTAEGDTYFTGGTASSRLMSIFTSTHGGGANAGHNFKVASGTGAFIFGNDTTANLLTVQTGGIDVTGSVTADGLTVDGDVTISDTTPSLLLMESDTTDVNTRLLNNGGDFFLSTINDAKSSVTNRFSLDHATGDISFYEDTGSTAKLTWDASEESLTFGTNLAITTNEIDVATGDFTLDVAGDIILDADGADVRFADGGTQYGFIASDSSSLVIKSLVSDKDIIFRGNDGGSGITALTLDMSAGGTAYFADDVRLTDNHAVRLGTDGDIVFYHDNSNAYLENGTGNFTLDVAGDIILDADGGDIRFFDGGTQFGIIFKSGNDLALFSNISDGDLLFRGNDGGSNFTALTLDMSAAGAATFNAGAVFNESGADSDFRVESDSNANMLFVDAGNDAVGIGTSSAGSFTIGDLVVGDGVGARGITIFAATDNESILRFADGTSGDQQYRGQIKYNHAEDSLNFHANGASGSAENLILKTSEAVFNEGGIDTDFRVESDNNTHALFVDGATGDISINRTSAAAKLDVNLGTTGDIAIFRGGDSDTLTIDNSDNAINLDTRNTTNGLRFQMQGATKATLDLNGSLKFHQDTVIGANTSDASDNQALYLCGGGNQTVGRGANIRVHGNEDSPAGDALIYSGNVANSEIQLRAYTNTSAIRQFVSETDRLSLHNDRAVFNDDSGDIDFRVESNNNANMIFVDAGSNEVGIGTGDPGATFDVAGAVRAKDMLIIQDSGYATLEMGGPSGAFIDLKSPSSDDFDGRIITFGSGMFLDVGTGSSLVLQAGGENRFEIDAGGEIAINETGLDRDFRIESDSNNQALLVDAGGDFVAMGNTIKNPVSGFADQHGVGIDVLNGDTQIASDSLPLELGRTSTAGANGVFLQMRAGGTAVGALRNVDSDLVIHTTTAGHEGLRLGDGYIAPTNNSGAVSDNSCHLGLDTARFVSLKVSSGVQFGNTSAAAQLLDDYEEGTWIPTINSGTMTASEATYTKIGNLVTVRANISDISDNTSTTDIEIGGLPFTAKSTNRGVGSSIFRYFSKTNAAQMNPYIHINATNLDLYWAFNADTAWTKVQFADGTRTEMDVIFTVSYITS